MFIIINIFVRTLNRNWQLEPVLYGLRSRFSQGLNIPKTTYKRGSIYTPFFSENENIWEMSEKFQGKWLTCKLVQGTPEQGIITRSEHPPLLQSREYFRWLEIWELHYQPVLQPKHQRNYYSINFSSQSRITNRIFVLWYSMVLGGTILGCLSLFLQFFNLIHS